MKKTEVCVNHGVLEHQGNRTSTEYIEDIEERGKAGEAKGREDGTKKTQIKREPSEVDSLAVTNDKEKDDVNEHASVDGGDGDEADEEENDNDAAFGWVDESNPSSTLVFMKPQSDKPSMEWSKQELLNYIITLRINLAEREDALISLQKLYAKQEQQVAEYMRLREQAEQQLQVEIKAQEKLSKECNSLRASLRKAHEVNASLTYTFARRKSELKASRKEEQGRAAALEPPLEPFTGHSNSVNTDQTTQGEPVDQEEKLRTDMEQENENVSDADKKI